MVIIILIVQIYGIEQAMYQGSDNRKKQDVLKYI